MKEKKVVMAIKRNYFFENNNKIKKERIKKGIYIIN